MPCIPILSSDRRRKKCRMFVTRPQPRAGTMIRIAKIWLRGLRPRSFSWQPIALGRSVLIPCERRLLAKHRLDSIRRIRSPRCRRTGFSNGSPTALDRHRGAKASTRGTTPDGWLRASRTRSRRSTLPSPFASLRQRCRQG